MRNLVIPGEKSMQQSDTGENPVNRFLLSLFQPDELVYVNFNAFEGSLAQASMAALLPNIQFVSANPMDSVNRNTKGAGTHRADINVCDFRNFVFESDSLPLELQESVLTYLTAQYPIRTAVFSGSKSLHLIISFSETIIDPSNREAAIARYKAIWTALSELLTRTTLTAFPQLTAILDGAPLFDPACKNPSRLTRIGGAIRDNGVEQSLLHIGRLADASLLDNLIIKHKSAATSNRVAPTEYDVDTFADLMNSELLYGLKFSLTSSVRHWAAASGMYHELFRLTCWAIDATGVNKSTLLNYLYQHTFPTLIEAGYPSDKIEKAIHHAYDYKD